MFAIHYLCASLGMPYDIQIENNIFIPTISVSVKSVPAKQENPEEQKQEIKQKPEFPLGQHENSRRFAGTKVQLNSPSISPDYKFIAKVEYTENGGKDVYLSWHDFMNRKIGPYKMRNEDSFVIVGLKDNDAGATAVYGRTSYPMQYATQEIQVTLPKATTQITEKHTTQSTHEYLKTLCRHLRREGIGFKPALKDVTNESTIGLIFDRYYVEFSDKHYELGSAKSGIIGKYKPSNLASLISKIAKIETNFNVESIVKNGSKRFD